MIFCLTILVVFVPTVSTSPSCSVVSNPEILYNWTAQHCSDNLPYQRDLPDTTIGVWLDRTRGEPVPVAIAGGRRGTYLNINYTATTAREWYSMSRTIRRHHAHLRTISGSSPRM